MRDPENTGKFTREILFPGPRIAVRADTVLDVVSRIYPLFIPKENSRQYRPGHWGARPPLFFSRKRKGKIKRKLPADVRKLKNGCEVRGKRTRRARSVAAVRQAIQLWASFTDSPRLKHLFPCSSFSAIFLYAFSHRPDWAASFGHRPRCGYLVIPHSDAGSRNTRFCHSAH